MKEAIGVIITNDKDEVLLIQRGPKARSQHGKWENCGGAVEEGENPEDACYREIKEEIGVDIVELAPAFVDEDPDGEWMVYMFEGKIDGTPEIKEKDVHSDLKWFKKIDLENVELTTYTQRDFERLGWVG